MNRYPQSLFRSSLVRLLCVLAVAASTLFLSHPLTANAATFTVTKTTDSKDGACNSDCSLREAVIAAHQKAGVDTITVPAGTYVLTLSDIDITSSLTIVGAGAGKTIIDGNARDRVFEVRPGVTVTIDKVTLRNGKLPREGDNGGGILNNGTLTLSNSTVSGNQAGIYSEGGGIYSTGALTISASTISGNGTFDNDTFNGGIVIAGGTLTMSNSTVSSNSGEGIGLRGGTTARISRSTISGSSTTGIQNQGALTLSESTVSGNRAYDLGGDGGGINNSGSLQATRTTISGNEATDSGASGGGLFNSDTGTATLTNSTVSGNTSYGWGGGIANAGTLTLENTTVTRNTVYNFSGGGMHTFSGTTTSRNTIVAGNESLEGASNPDCSGPITSQGYNLIQDTTGCTITGDTTGNLTGMDAKLGALQNNGGATQTHLPASDSPVIDAGNPAAPGSSDTACTTTDQRGQARPKDGNGDGVARCDIGAVER